MKGKAIGFAVALLMSCFAATAVADQWLDEVILFDRPTGSSNDGHLPEDALGPPDDRHVSIDIPETFIAAFVDNTALDGLGNDLHVYQRYRWGLRCGHLRKPG
jgi:hypothetical protein